MKKKVRVVGAIIENNRGEILCALRSFDMALSNYWEFPGGKIEDGETIKETIEREIIEELECKIEAESVAYDTSTYEYDSVFVELTTIKCRIVEGTPRATEHQQIMWLDKRYLKSLVWAPADIPAIEKLLKEV